MKKLNNNGFVLAETLVVTVFLMVLFTLLYTNYYPLIGEYEKRESYDDVDGKYAAYWIKKLIEDRAYKPSNEALKNLENKGYMRFSCLEVDESDEARSTCRNMLESLEVTSCDTQYRTCDVFITYYRIGGTTPDFKETVSRNLYKYEENCQDNNKSTCMANFKVKCKNRSISSVCASISDETECEKLCEEEANKKVFKSGFKDYVAALPNYSTQSLNYAKFRVIISSHHVKDNNNFYSYSTIEVNK